MRNPMMPLAALLLGLAGPALAQQAPTDDAARTLAQNARVSFSRPVTTPPAQVSNAAPALPVAIPRVAQPPRRLAMAANPAR